MGSNFIGLSMNRDHEAGMLEVIKEIAFRRYLEVSGDDSENPMTVEAVKRHSEMLDELKSKLGEGELDFFLDFEEIANHLNTCERRDEFILGFIEGYRFIKEIRSSCGGVS